MTPEQRFVYWNYLKNPYNNKFDVGYAFVLYYGLERFMTIPEKFEMAFNVVLKLRDVFDNKSFQNYSSNALILLCAVYERADLLDRFIRSCNNDYEKNIDGNLNLLVNYTFDIPLSADFLMKYHKVFEFENTNYIRKNPDIFKTKLNELILEKFPNGIYLSQLIKKNELYSHYRDVSIFCNYSMDQSIKIPDLTECFKIKMAMFQLLTKTHELVKEEVKKQRIDGTLTEKKVSTKEKDIIIVDYDAIDISGYNPFDLNNIPLINSFNDELSYTNKNAYYSFALSLPLEAENLQQLKAYEIAAILFNEMTDYEKKVMKYKTSNSNHPSYCFGVNKYETSYSLKGRNISAEILIDFLCILLPECKSSALRLFDLAVSKTNANDYYKAYAYHSMIVTLYKKNANQETLELCADLAMKEFELKDFWFDWEHDHGILLDSFWISIVNILKKLKRYDDAIAFCDFSIAHKDQIYGDGWQERLDKIISAKEKEMRKLN